MGGDHTLARIFLEAAEEDLVAARKATATSTAVAGSPSAEAAPPGTAAAVVLRDVIPRYRAALEPARPPAPRSPAQVTVTLVRWPFT